MTQVFFGGEAEVLVGTRLVDLKSRLKGTGEIAQK